MLTRKAQLIIFITNILPTFSFSKAQRPLNLFVNKLLKIQ
ncbi:hypothetical protein PPAR_a2648 [Pseudoalteromonas paragorgicola KMM 3548]|nr:hypothetical protein [Pseudoalteromonas distincta KMM 3548]